MLISRFIILFWVTTRISLNALMLGKKLWMDSSSRLSNCYWTGWLNFDSETSHFAVVCDTQKNASTFLQMLLSQ